MLDWLGNRIQARARTLREELPAVGLTSLGWAIWTLPRGTELVELVTDGRRVWFRAESGRVYGLGAGYEVEEVLQLLSIGKVTFDSRAVLELSGFEKVPVAYHSPLAIGTDPRALELVEHERRRRRIAQDLDHLEHELRTLDRPPADPERRERRASG